MRSPFWNSFFEHFSGCGKNSALFVFALLLISVAGVGIPLTIAGLDGDPMLGLVGGGVAFIFACLLLGFIPSWGLQTGKSERLGRLPPLQRADLRAARAKLLKNHQSSPRERQARAVATNDFSKIDL